MYFYSDNIIGGEASDITVVMENGDVYSGKFDRSRVKAGTDLKEQAIWQITKTAVTKADGVSTYETLYPNGVKGFMFKWSELESLTYTYCVN